MNLLERAEEFEHRKFSFKTTSDRIVASREVKALILELNDVYKLEKDPEIMALVRRFYSNAYATGGLDTARILNSQCFNDKLSEEAVDEFNRGFALIHQTMVEGLK